jgi:thiol-disulfide isomerase/thioredoxin
MKYIGFIYFFMSVLVLSAQQSTARVVDEKGTVLLLGPTTKADLQTAEFPWFEKNQETYLTNTAVITQLAKELPNYTIKVFYGTWCGDSKREVPRFYKVLEEASFPIAQLELIAVDRKATAYKQAPNGEEKGWRIHRVPTVVVLKDGKEVGRIVEYPKQDFERDMLKLVQGETYRPNYRVANYLYSLLESSTWSELKNQKAQLMASFVEHAKGSKELNTLGYKLWRSGAMDKALFVFELNAGMYANNAYILESLASLQKELKLYTAALETYKKALQLQPKNNELQKEIREVSEVIKKSNP